MEEKLGNHGNVVAEVLSIPLHITSVCSVFVCSHFIVSCMVCLPDEMRMRVQNARKEEEEAAQVKEGSASSSSKQRDFKFYKT